MVGTIRTTRANTRQVAYVSAPEGHLVYGQALTFLGVGQKVPQTDGEIGSIASKYAFLCVELAPFIKKPMVKLAFLGCLFLDLNRTANLMRVKISCQKEDL